MKLSELTSYLQQAETLDIEMPDGSYVPDHFHITEVGLVDKHFIDCGGTIRHEKHISMQVWTANDTDHRLQPSKLLSILGASKAITGDEDLDVEVEYQTGTIGRYAMSVRRGHLILDALQTACLAEDQCGIPQPKANRSLAEIMGGSCCTPGGGCC
jgi:hypothetical protein